jgi:predicted aspartyl protease
MECKAPNIPTMVRKPARSMLRWGLAASIALGALLPLSAIADCQLARIMELPVSEEHPRPSIPVELNGHPENFVLDSGAIDNMVSAPLAAQLKLQTYYAANASVRRRGVPASRPIEIARIKELKFADLVIKNGELSVIGGEATSDGVLGQNILQHFAVEYDFGGGMMRLFISKGCESAKFAYWLGPDQQYSSLHIGLVDASNPYTMGEAYINGHRLKVAFDSGMGRSLLTREAAERIGIKMKGEEVVDIGYTKRNGWDPVRTYMVRVKSFKIGDNEQISNIRLPVADVQLRNVDMLLGTDFFMAHRIIVGNKEERLLMSYRGGPVFDSSRDAAGLREKASSSPTD